MEFFIRQGATDPILKLRIVDDGKNHSSFNDLLENSSITFDMFDYSTKEYYILNGQCNIVKRNDIDEYYIVYRFSEESTSVIGRYEGVITIQFLDSNSNPTNKLIVPIAEKLYINII